MTIEFVIVCFDWYFHKKVQEGQMDGKIFF
jgi:hypothetical protein